MKSFENCLRHYSNYKGGGSTSETRKNAQAALTLWQSMPRNSSQRADYMAEVQKSGMKKLGWVHSWTKSHTHTEANSAAHTEGMFTRREADCVTLPPPLIHERRIVSVRKTRA